MGLSVTDTINDQPMSSAQIIAICVCVYLLALDGFDVLAIAFAAPGISEEWGLAEGVLGWVVTMELIGMAIGSIFMGNLADRFGRRPILLFSAVIMTLGMLAAAAAPNVYVLSGFRILTGIGIGAVLATANAMVAELANNKHRSSLVMVMAGGYSFGVVIGGLVATELLEVYNWRSVFYLGAAGSAIAIPLVLMFLPESISYLVTKRPAKALEKINSILGRFKKPLLAELPEVTTSGQGTGFRILFGSRFLKITLLLSIAYLTHISTFYFVLKWVPKLVTDMGFTASQGGSILVWVNFGGLAGSLVLALAMQFFDVRRLAIAFVIGAAVFVSLFGQVNANMSMLALASIGAGFFSNSAAGAMFPLMAKYFPTKIRASGSGVVLGIGRAGAISGPVLAGYLLEAQIPLAQVAMIISIGSMIAAIAIFLLGAKPVDENA